MNEIETELEEIRTAYPPAERAQILDTCLRNLADESINRGGLLSTEDLLAFLKAARPE